MTEKDEANCVIQMLSQVLSSRKWSVQSINKWTVMIPSTNCEFCLSFKLSQTSKLTLSSGEPAVSFTACTQLSHGWMMADWPTRGRPSQSQRIPILCHFCAVQCKLKTLKTFLKEFIYLKDSQYIYSETKLHNHFKE